MENKRLDKFKIFLRPTLAIIIGFIGVLVSGSVAPLFGFAPLARFLFILVAFVAFAILGFILPDILELAGRASVAALALQIASHLPSGSAGKLVAGLSLGRKGKRGAKKWENGLLVDTSALIDGRLADVVETGFLWGTLLVMPSVIGELHMLSDSADEVKRQRGRRGLDVLSTIQKNKKIKTVVLATEPKNGGVDEKLIKLAQQIGAKVVTVDFNLNKVSRVRGIDVLNLNELANALKSLVLPEDKLRVKISSFGKEQTQGVGYLRDGTMVVVEEGSSMKGKTVDVVVHKVLQTAAGKMIFSKLAKSHPES